MGSWQRINCVSWRQEIMCLTGMWFSLNMRKWERDAYINLKNKTKQKTQRRDFIEDTRCEVERTTEEKIYTVNMKFWYKTLIYFLAIIGLWRYPTRWVATLKEFGTSSTMLWCGLISRHCWESLKDKQLQIGDLSLLSFCQGEVGRDQGAVEHLV